MPSDEGAERIRETINGAEEIRREPPRPLVRELPPSDPFPVDVLGPVLQAAAEAIHDRVQAPLAICGQSVLAAATLAAQAHADIELPTEQPRPLSCNFITVGASGERKTACDQEALLPIRHHEKMLRERREPELLSYLNDSAAWNKAREMAMKRNKGDRANIKAALDALGPAPTAPLDPLLTCDEPTYEGLCRLYRSGWPSWGFFRQRAASSSAGTA